MRTVFVSPSVHNLLPVCGNTRTARTKVCEEGLVLEQAELIAGPKESIELDAQSVSWSRGFCGAQMKLCSCVRDMYFKSSALCVAEDKL
jgi:hypothetical protein